MEALDRRTERHAKNGGEMGMTEHEKREKVLRGLSAHVNGHPHTRCHKCPYWGTGPHGSSECNVLAADALALLKAQEQQATTPDAEWLLFRGRKGATCSYCKRTFYDVYDVENYDYYCRHCGARMVKIRTVKWE